MEEEKVHYDEIRECFFRGIIKMESDMNIIKNTNSVILRMNS